MHKHQFIKPHFPSIPIPRPESSRGIRDVQDALRFIVIIFFKSFPTKPRQYEQRALVIDCAKGRR
jgi:hypothetical protein